VDECKLLPAAAARAGREDEADDEDEDADGEAGDDSDVRLATIVAARRAADLLALVHGAGEGLVRVSFVGAIRAGLFLGKNAAGSLIHVRTKARGAVVAAGSGGSVGSGGEERNGAR